VNRPEQVVVVGGGPAGLTAAYELVREGGAPLVLERGERVGGIARTEVHEGYRFDIGGHRFFTKVPEVEALWHEVLTDDFIRVPRLSRIYYRERFFRYPLEPVDALLKLGPVESALGVLSYLRWKIRPYPSEENLEQWVTNRFGRRLYETFFKVYTEKIWGIPCTEIQADWAAQRIRGLSLRTAVTNALFGRGEAKTLITEFDYPRLGPGMMWERFQERIEEKGGRVLLRAEVIGLRRQGARVESVTVREGDEERSYPADAVLSSMPLPALLRSLDPPPPARILEAAAGLRYRDFLIVTLILDREDLFPDQWIYIHSPGVRVGRVQNFGNWSPELVPEKGRSCLGLEYFCNEGEDLWEMEDGALIEIARSELDTLGLAGGSRVLGGTVIRQRKAYPVYDRDYRKHLAAIRPFLESLENVQTLGRNGMHRYNNQDHSMLTGLLGARNLLGESHDLWEVNTERSYHEDFQTLEGR
jgi:protoporphyrinogen oxidase